MNKVKITVKVKNGGKPSVGKSTKDICDVNISYGTNSAEIYLSGPRATGTMKIPVTVTYNGQTVSETITVTITTTFYYKNVSFYPNPVYVYSGGYETTFTLYYTLRMIPLNYYELYDLEDITWDFEDNHYLTVVDTWYSDDDYQGYDTKCALNFTLIGRSYGKTIHTYMKIYLRYTKTNEIMKVVTVPVTIIP